MEELRDAPALLLLRQHALGEERSLGLVHGQSIIASRSAIATACVRVSASSFARMCRTWLFTVSWLMKSFAATSALDIPSARSWRISRSRGVSTSAWPCAGDELGHETRVDERLAGGDLLDRAQERLVRSLLEDVALGARLEPALQERALAVGGEDENADLGHELKHLLGRLEAVHVRHAEIHDHDVGASPLCEGDRRRAVRRLADDADARRARQCEAKALPNDLVVVRDEAGDLVGHGAILRRGLG